jgi:1-acyl-sn-glycerol-3-phosphate acyltransferase
LSREVLVGAILEFLADQDLLTLRDIRAALEREIDRAGDTALLALTSSLFTDHGWDYYASDPLARRIHHLLADRFLGTGSEVCNAHYLALVAGVPVVIVANHLSYADANVIEVLLHRAGSEMANRLTALAGPKIFTSRQRRFSSLCFGTVKVPQSAEVASEEAVLNAREVAQAARHAITVAHERLREGDALLLFGEGTRSRTGGMQPLLAGAARYLEVPGSWVLPAGLAGSDALFPVEGSLHPARAAVQLGRPFHADTLLARTHGDRRLTMDVIGLAVAETLSPEYRGAYSNTESFPDAWNVLRAVRDVVT